MRSSETTNNQPDKLRVLHVGPGPIGLGGIETVIRTYIGTQWQNILCESLCSWRGSTSKRIDVVAFASLLFGMANTVVKKRPDVIHIHFSHYGSFVREGGIALTYKLLRFRVLATIHGSAFVSSSSASRSLRILYSLVLRRLDGISVLNDQSAEVAQRLAPRTPVVQLSNPGPVSVDDAHEPRPGSCEPIAVFIGTVGVRKGVDLLIDAWRIVESKCPNAQLEVWGPIENGFTGDSERKYVKGPISPSEVQECLRRARVAVLPSRAEAMPMFVLEALASGRPVVVSDVGAMRSQIGGGGTVLSTLDAEHLAKVLLTYLNDAELADSHGEAARERYVHKFGKASFEMNLLNFYRHAGVVGRIL